MSTLIPPSSHFSGDATSIDGVTVTGTPTSGQVITATDATDATWQTPAGGPGGQLVTGFIGLPVFGNMAETLLADFAVQVQAITTAPPLIVAASGTVGYVIQLFDVPDISDTLDVFYKLYLTNQLGTSTGLVSGNTSTSTPASSFAVDFTGTTATILGVDLTWTDTSGEFTSAAGDIYTAMLYVNTNPD